MKINKYKDAYDWAYIFLMLDPWQPELALEYLENFLIELGELLNE